MTAAATADTSEGIVTRDPALALKAASRDKLLDYHGFVAPGGYEVVIGGRSLVLSEDDVIDAVQRLRAIDNISATLVELRGDGTHVIAVGSRPPVELSSERVIDWCDGFFAAWRATGEEHTGQDTIAKIAKLFDEPDLNDQCRMVILGLMYGRGPEHKVTSQQLADRIGDLPGVAKRPAKKTVLDALGFGAGFASSLREVMIQVFGLRWSDVFAPLWRPVPGEQPKAFPLDGGLPEHPSLAVLRRIVAASRRGWLRYLDEEAPNEARWRTRFTVAVGVMTYELDVVTAATWLDGLAFHHGT